MKTAYATIGLNQTDEYTIRISVTDDNLTSGADGWDAHAPTYEMAVSAAEGMLLDYCNDGECENGGVFDRTGGERVQADVELNVVMTPAEIATAWDVKEDTVRDAAQHCWIPARKSASTWLIRRADAEARWGKRSE